MHRQNSLQRYLMAMPDEKGRKVYCQSKFKKKQRLKGSTRFSNREITGDLEENSVNKTTEAEPD